MRFPAICVEGAISEPIATPRALLFLLDTIGNTHLGSPPTRAVGRGTHALLAIRSEAVASSRGPIELFRSCGLFLLASRARLQRGRDGRDSHSRDFAVTSPPLAGPCADSTRIPRVPDRLDPVCRIPCSIRPASGDPFRLRSLRRHCSRSAGIRECDP